MPFSKLQFLAKLEGSGTGIELCPRFNAGLGRQEKTGSVFPNFPQRYILCLPHINNSVFKQEVVPGYKTVHPRMGAVAHVEGVAFRMWAPNAGSCSAVGEFNDLSSAANPMQHERNGFWYAVVSNARVGDEYRYFIHNGEADFTRIHPNRAVQNHREVESAIPTNSDLTIDDFKDLAASIELIWQNKGSSERFKKRIIRTLIHEIIVDLNETAGEINLVIHWQSGINTELSVPRRKRGKATVTPSDTINAVRVLTRVCTD